VSWILSQLLMFRLLAFRGVMEQPSWRRQIQYSRWSGEAPFQSDVASSLHWRESDCRWRQLRHQRLLHSLPRVLVGVIVWLAASM